MSRLILGNVLLKEHFTYIDNERFSLVIKKAEQEKYKLDNSKSYNLNFTEKKALELANTKPNSDFTNLEKLIYVSNIIFPNDKRFVNGCSYGGFTKEKLETLNSFFKLLKSMPREEQKKILHCDMINEIIQFSKKYFGINNAHYFYNKAIQLSVTKPEIFIKK